MTYGRDATGGTRCATCGSQRAIGEADCLTCSQSLAGAADRDSPVENLEAVELQDGLNRALGNRYTIERVLGAGGMATVYLAVDLKHGRRVAIKVMRPELSSAVNAERFVREIRVAAQLNHRHIAALFDSGAVGEFLYYVMPYVEGPSLRDHLRTNGPLPVDEAIRLAGEIADGLQAAHEQGVIHRDIKPENVLLLRGHALIADFGIAKAFSASGGESLTKTGLVVGTPKYMSPEQARGEASIDHRTDIYSLGCMLFEMLAGTPPFTGATPIAVVMRHAAEERPSVRALRGGVPAHVDAALHTAMAIEASERFATVAEFAVALASASRLKEGEREGSVVVAATKTLPTRRTSSERWEHRTRWTLSALAVGGIGLATIFAYRFIERDGQSRAGSLTFSETPLATPWKGIDGEHFSVIAVADSALLVYRYGAPEIHALSGGTWRALAVPDSFELRPFQGTLRGGRLLATRRSVGREGATTSRLWWLELTPAGLRPLEPITDPESSVAQPFWWTDGVDVVTWLESIRVRAPSGWSRERTGVAAQVRALWGRDLAHRFAVADAPRDSLLVHDSLGWQLKDILPDQSAGRPSYDGGTTLDDGTAVILGETCTADSLCAPLVMQLGDPDESWVRVAIRRGVGLPLRQRGRDGAGFCSDRLILSGVAGTSRHNYFIWGEWTLCNTLSRRAEWVGCPPAQPCAWNVRNGVLLPLAGMTGKVVASTATVGGVDYIVTRDGALWRRAQETWRFVEQVPGLPARLVAAGSQMVARFGGVGGVTYEPSSGARSRMFVSPVQRLPSSVSDRAPPRRITVGDSSLVLVTAAGEVLRSICRSASAADPDRRLPPCGAWQPLDGLSERASDAAVLPEGAVLAIGRRGTAAVWRDRAWESESVPAEVASDSLWGLHVSERGAAMAIGASAVLTRDPTQGRWSIVHLFESGTGKGEYFAVLPGGGFAVAGPWVQVWAGAGEPRGPLILHRPALGEPRVGALHALRDGRLIVGFSNPAEPSQGGWLQVWSRPPGDTTSRRVSLPLTVDISDLADDGTTLFVVGRGGSMEIPLDQLPFAPIHAVGVPQASSRNLPWRP